MLCILQCKCYLVQKLKYLNVVLRVLKLTFSDWLNLSYILHILRTLNVFVLLVITGTHLVRKEV